MRMLLLAALVSSCARPALAPLHEDHAELVTTAAVGSGDRVWDVLGEPVARGARDAVVDDGGYVGTLRTTATAPCLLACDDCCRKAEWLTAWVDTPREPRTGLVLAVGPVDGRLASARRELPPSVDPEGNPWAWSFVRTEGFRTLARFGLGSEPSALEARGRMADGARVVELRVNERGAWRVVARTVERPDGARTAD